MIEQRRVEPVDIPDLQRGAIGAPPSIAWVAPGELWIEPEYQRDIGRRSLELVRTIAEGWDWGKFSPPSCRCLEDGRLVITDGQHTAIGAATAGVDRIPVLVVAAGELADRASDFIGHNKNRLGMTKLQVHRAAVTAGDDVALAIEDACRKAGARLCPTTRSNDRWDQGDTVALGAIAKVVAAKGRAGGTRVLKILVQADHRPIPALLIAAVHELLYSPEWAWKDDAAVVALLSQVPASVWAELAAARRTPGQSAGRTLAVDLYRLLTGGK